MSGFEEMLNTLKDVFDADDAAQQIIACERREAESWVSDNEPEEPSRSPRALGDLDVTSQPSGARSVFDDVDAEHG